MKERIKEGLRKGINKAIGADISYFRDDALAMYSLESLSKDLLHYYPYTSMAMDFMNLKIVLNDIVINQRRNIVECGAGISTVYIASLLRKNDINATFITIEEDEGWASYLTSQLEKEGLANYSRIIHAPIENNEGVSWYSLAIIREIKQSIGNVDCLIVDAPIAYLEGREKIRGGAVPNFIDIFNKKGSIFLDDCDRQGEKNVLKYWEKEYGLKFSIYKRLGYYIQGESYQII